MNIGTIAIHNEFSIPVTAGKQTPSGHGRLLVNPLTLDNGVVDIHAKTRNSAKKLTRGQKKEQQSAWKDVLSEMTKANCDFNWVTVKNRCVMNQATVEEIVKRFTR
jgi:flagellar hook-basal body complex protein FliE